MKNYTFVLEYYNRANEVQRVTFRTEKELISGALEADRKGYMLKEALRETWETKHKIMTLIKIEGYDNGKPQRLVWEKT